MMLITIVLIRDQEQCAKLLNHTSNHGWTCLYYAAERRERDIIMLVLETGAGIINRKCSLFGASGCFKPVQIQLLVTRSSAMPYTLLLDFVPWNA